MAKKNVVRLHKIGNYTYVCTQEFMGYEDNKKLYRYIHWGVIDEDRNFEPGINFINASNEKLNNLDFSKIRIKTKKAYENLTRERDLTCLFSGEDF